MIIDEVVEFNDLNKEAEEMHRQTYNKNMELFTYIHFHFNMHLF